MSGRNSAYSPLPQSNSDSEGSSEELHIAQENRIVNRISKVDNFKPEKTFTGPKSNANNYKLLNSDGDFGATLIKFQSTTDEVSILKPNKIEIFSTTRKLCFVFSLLLCVFTTVIFIWFLPCNERTCLSMPFKSKILSWDKTVRGLEIYGPIGIITDTFGNAKNLVFSTRKPLSEANKNYMSKSGLISLMGENGDPMWNISLNKDPTDIDCRLIDINSDGINDCLVFGTSFLKAIDSVSGNELWEFHNYSMKKSTTHHFDFPLIIYDIDGDGVKDLLTSCSFINIHENTYSAETFQRYLTVISGKTGVIINEPLEIKSCSRIHNLDLDNYFIISYTCHNLARKESQQTISLDQLMTPQTVLNTTSVKVLHQHQRYSDSILINGHKLIVDNQGRCPENCNVLVDVKDDYSKNNSLFIKKFKNTYCMIPAILKPSGETNLILKFWKWESKKNINDDNFSVQRMMAFKSSKKLNKRANKFKKIETLDNEMLLESEEGLERRKRAAIGPRKTFATETKNSAESTLYLHVISETIMLIKFNKSQDPVVQNITEDKIIQICRKAQICEPDVQSQKHSLLIADLNNDGEKELISFSSKYSHEELKLNNSWRLQSLVKVITVK